MAMTDGPKPDEYWSLAGDEVLRALGSTPRGLPHAEAERRLMSPDRARPLGPERASEARLLLSQFTSPITVMLLAAALLSMIVGEGIDGAIILGALVVSISLGFWQEHRAGQAVSRLLSRLSTTATVLRQGAELEVAVESVVTGDVVLLAAGAAIPGDALLLESKDLFVDESVLTGESWPAEKATGPVPPDAPLQRRTNAVYLGTHVVGGTATAVVVRTGRATEYGAIAHRLAASAPETEFQKGVRRFGQLLLEIAIVLVVVIFAINVARERPVIDALLFTLALAVGLTPQLLPAIVTVTLSQGARHMAAQRVIVRRLASIEDLGGMDILCTDKTGTITEGVVSVHAVEDWNGAVSESATLLAHLNAALHTGFPNPIDDALRALVIPGAAAFTKVDEVPYDFVRRRSSVVVTDGHRTILVTKGAVASVLEICDSTEDAAGCRVPLDEVREGIEARFESLSRDAYRCLGLACREVPMGQPVGRAEEEGLTFLGFITLADPLRRDAAQSLADLARLGVVVKLLTGDNQHVAMRIAAEAGLDVSSVLVGEQLHRLSEAALVTAAPRIAVFAEIEPTQKERIIRALKRSGHAVGYLGDGINDAAALHAADVGISVDNATDVTREAADIVLLEKDLAVLGRGVREGRRAFANTLKYIFITTSANFGNMFSMAGASLVATFLPLLPKQILLTNVLTDLPAMAIATDDLDPELVARPRRWDNRGLRNFMIVFGLVSSCFDFLTFGALLWLGTGVATFRTAWFLESVLSELFILLVIRTRRTFFRSRVGGWLFAASIIVGVVTLALPYMPFAALLGLAPLPVSLLLTVAGIVTFYVIASEATKRLMFRRIPM
jgi:Mg2+-importing ATPase